jgi:hypothetical protein
MKQISHRRSEPTLEVQLTLTQLRCVVKSLSIGTDQLAKKIQRHGDNSRADLAYTEFQALLEAKQELESVLNAGLAGDDLSWSND